jgi:hypothetical protein
VVLGLHKTPRLEAETQDLHPVVKAEVQHQQLVTEAETQDLHPLAQEETQGPKLIDLFRRSVPRQRSLAA